MSFSAREVLSISDQGSTVRKFVWFIAILFTLFVGGIFAAPSVIDWSQYKGQLTSKFVEFTGRDLSIDGPLDVTLWPSPTLVANKITLANSPSGHAPKIAVLKAVELRVALLPLFLGRVHVKTVKLIEPIIELEKFVDGQTNWTFAKIQRKAEKKHTFVPTPDKNQGINAPEIAFDNFVIENGIITYRDMVDRRIERAEQVNATITATSIKGPAETSGSLILRGIPIEYTASIGQLIQNRTVPINADIKLGSGSIFAELSGTLVNLNTPLFKGKIGVEGRDLRDILKQSSIRVPHLSRELPIKLSGSVSASTEAVSLNEIRVDVAGIRATGDVEVDLTSPTRFGAIVAIKQFDLNELLTTFKSTTPQADNQKKQYTFTQTTKSSKPAKNKNTPIVSTKRTAAQVFAMPKNFEGSIILTTDAIGYRNGVIRDLAINAELTKGELSIGQISAQLPGGSDAILSGRLSTDDKLPKFTGNVEATINDFRAIAAWLGVSLPPLPTDRLRKIIFNANLVATPEQVQATGVNFRFDSSTIQGSLTLARRKRIGLGVAVVLDRLNIDAYLAQTTSTRKTLRTKGLVQKNSASNEQKHNATRSKAPTSNDPFAVLNALSSFDANFNVHVKSLIYGGVPVKDLVTEGTLNNGNLDLRRFSIGSLAEATANISGRLSELTSFPSVENLSFGISIPNVNSVLTLAGERLPINTKKLGTIVLKGQMYGNLISPSLNAAISMAGAKIKFDGRLSPLSSTGVLSGKTSFTHRNLRSFLRRLDFNYRPSRKIGRVELKTKFKAGKNIFHFSELSGFIGQTKVSGEITANFLPAKPHITATLKTGVLNIEKFLPAQKNAGIPNFSPQLIPAAWLFPMGNDDYSLPHLRNVKLSHWSTSPLSLSALNEFDALINLESDKLVYRQLIARNSNINAEISGGILNLSRFQARLFGGTVLSTANINVGNNSIRAQANMRGLSVGSLLQTTTGKQSAKGKMDADFNINTSGTSISALVEKLGGKARFNISAIDVNNAAEGSVLASIFDLLQALNRLAGISTDKKAHIGASFNVMSGIATTRDLRLASLAGDGSAGGEIDLSNWTINLKGEITVAETLLTSLLKERVRGLGRAIPFTIMGSLEEPNVRINTGTVFNSGASIPNADTLLNKAPKSVRRILRGILQGPQQQNQRSSNNPQLSPSKRSKDEKSQQISPERLLKQLFKL